MQLVFAVTFCALTIAAVTAQLPNDDWQCIGDIATPIRRFGTSDVACASGNAKDCYWNSNMVECMNFLKKTDWRSTVKPLQCGEHHRQQYGSTGYNDGNHWCNKGFNILKDYPGRTKWKCYPGIFVPIRYNYWGNVECLSPNRRDCYWKNNIDQCNDLIKNPPPLIVPLPCGPTHLSEWGVTGYHDPNHWCRIIIRLDEYGAIIPLSAPVGPLPTLDFKCPPSSNIPIRRTPRFEDMECFSTDGKTCISKGSNYLDCNAWLATDEFKNLLKDVNPVRCSRYDDPNDWCVRLFDALDHHPQRTPYTCIPGIFTPVRLNFFGDVECISRNGHDCLVGKNDNECLQILRSTLWPSQNYVPLSCGQQHQREWGFTGYGDPNHWCVKSGKTLNACCI